MNWKIVFVGGVAYYATFFLLSMIGGNLIHGPEGVLADAYRDYASFWRPELNAVPPDMASLMKKWVPIGLLSSCLLAAVYSAIRPAFAGSDVVRGLKFGVVGWIFGLVAALGYWGILDLPNKVWTWWQLEAIWMHLIAGAVLGWVAGKVAPSPA